MGTHKSVHTSAYIAYLIHKQNLVNLGAHISQSKKSTLRHLIERRKLELADPYKNPTFNLAGIFGMIRD